MKPDFYLGPMKRAEEPPITSSPQHDKQHADGRIQKPRRSEIWTLAVGVLILLGLLGHILNQQRASRGTPDNGIGPQRQQSSSARSSAETTTPTVQQSPTPRDRAEKTGDTRERSQVVYAVTHKHRLRDCHGTLTFTRAALQFESDEPEDAFAVGLADVSVEGDAVRLRDKTWRFGFPDGVRAERIFQGWKTGTLFWR
jgi:hypothetical protein